MGFDISCRVVGVCDIKTFLESIRFDLEMEYHAYVYGKFSEHYERVKKVINRRYWALFRSMDCRISSGVWEINTYDHEIVCLSGDEAKAFLPRVVVTLLLDLLDSSDGVEYLKYALSGDASVEICGDQIEVDVAQWTIRNGRGCIDYHEISAAIKLWEEKICDMEFVTKL